MDSAYRDFEMMQDEHRALEAIPVKQEFKVWEPVEYDMFFDSGVLQSSRYLSNKDSTDPIILEAGLAHPTKEAAERHHEFLKMLRELEKFAVEHNEGWKPDYKNEDEQKWNISFFSRVLKPQINWMDQHHLTPCFKSRELAQKAIDTFGDRLKILFEYYNS